MSGGYGLCAARDPWVLVADRRGAQREVTVLDALTDPQAGATLAGHPPVVAATVRFLLALVLDATGGVCDEAEWSRWWAGGIPREPLREYLQRHAPRMYLHGPRPFLQDPDVPQRVGYKSVAELAPHMPTGLNPVIYGHTTGLDGPRPAVFAPAEAVRWLVAFHQHARTGMWPNTARPGPAVGVAGPLTDRLLAIPTAGSVARTVLLSLLPAQYPGPGARPGALPWRRTQAVLNRPPQCVAELLCPVTRHVLLVAEPDGGIKRLLVGVDPALAPCFPRDLVAAWDPHIGASEVGAARHPSGWVLSTFDPAASALRSAYALTRATAGAGAARALAGRAGVIGAEPVHLEVFGLRTENGGKYVAWTRESAPAPGIAGDQARRAVHIAEHIAHAAGYGAYLAYKDTSRNPDAARARFAGAFWDNLAPLADDMVAHLGDAESDEERRTLIDAWRTRTARLAHRTIEEMTGSWPVSIRTIHALSGAHRVISAAVTTTLDPDFEESGR
jgi:hypothetical protein